jgi:glutathione S-transferase
MSDCTLVIGNKNYSSWSLRAWLAAKVAGLAFEEILIPLDESNTRQQILRHAPSGRVPVLKHGERTIWESLSICEYLAELLPDARLWPADVEARAIARSVSAEMHAGFAALRTHMPMNVRSRFPEEGRKPGVLDDINRVTAIWRGCRRRLGETPEGPFLFGHFTVADAMFAPVVTRFRTYAVDIGDDAQAYADAIWALPAMQEWSEASKNEPMVIDKAEF